MITINCFRNADLTFEMRLVMRLRFLGFSYRDIGIILNADSGNVEKLESKSLQKIKSYYGEETYESVIEHLNGDCFKRAIGNKAALNQAIDNSRQMGKIEVYLECGYSKNKIAEKLGINLYQLNKILQSNKRGQ